MVPTGKRRGALARAVSAALILISAPPVAGRKCYWCGPLAEQVHRSARAPPCASPAPATLTTCDEGHGYCATVAAAPPYIESRYCVKLYQDECYHLYCNTTKTWRMTCPCRGDLCNGPNLEREQEAFTILSKIVSKTHRVKKRHILTPTAQAVSDDITYITIYNNTDGIHNDDNGTYNEDVEIHIENNISNYVKNETEINESSVKILSVIEYTNANEELQEENKIDIELNTKSNDNYDTLTPTYTTDVKKDETTSEENIEPQIASNNDYGQPSEDSSGTLSGVVESQHEADQSTSTIMQPTSGSNNFKDEISDKTSVKNEIPLKDLQNLKPTISYPTTEALQQTNEMTNYQGFQPTILTDNYKYERNNQDSAENGTSPKKTHGKNSQTIKPSEVLPTAEALHQTDTVQSRIDSTPSPQKILETTQTSKATSPPSDKKVEQTTQDISKLTSSSTLPTKKFNEEKNNALTLRVSYYKQIKFFAILFTLFRNIM